ncbi:MAG: hypothetical protein FJ246_03670 [Nitrospira sp.]|nr:hypothetical protein [Nitrospira sp.]
MNTVPAAGFTFGKAIADGALLDLRLSAGESLGLVKVIAAPKITTLDKRDAKIETGEAIPFQTTSLQGTQTTFVDALLSLQITPQITSRDPKEVGKQVLLKIKATRNALGSQSFTAGPASPSAKPSRRCWFGTARPWSLGGLSRIPRATRSKVFRFSRGFRSSAGSSKTRSRA